MAARREEVNAWGSYEVTARSARALSTRRAPHGQQVRRRGSSVSIPGRELRRGSVPILTPARTPNTDDDIETGGRRMTLASEGGTDWSKIFEKQGLHISRHSAKFGITRLPDKEPEVIPGEDISNKKLTPKLLKDIREIFLVYFEENESITSARREKHKSTLIKYLTAVNATMPWLQSYIEKNLQFSSILLFIERCLRGISQVYFQNNPITGLLILAGMIVQSTRVAIHGILALVCGNLAAYLLGFDTGLISSGLFGYNAFLVGLALATFYSTSEHQDYYGPVALATIVVSSFASVLFVVMGKLLVPYRSPPLTLPFNVATLIFLLGTAEMLRVDMDPVRTPALPDYFNSESIGTIEGKEFFKGVFRGIGQVFLADNLASGLLVLAGIAVCSRIAALSAFLGSAVGAAMALATGVPMQSIVSGFYGFNASLSFTAMLMFYAPSIGSFVMGTLASIMTVAGQQALAGALKPYGLPFMTLPFCVIALPFVILQGTTTIVVAVPLASMTIPEDHLRRVKMLSDGFQFLKDALRPEEEHKNYVKRYGRKFARSLTSLSEAIALDPAEQNVEKHSKPWYSWRVMEQKTMEKEPWVFVSATLIFQALDEGRTGHLDATQFTDALQMAGLKDEAGLNFAALVFNLLDLDSSDSIELNEFRAFATVSRCLSKIRRNIQQFMDFVDSNGDSYIDFGEIDAALEYLGEEGLDAVDRETLISLNEFDEDDGGIDATELINFVTVAKVKSLVAAYQDSTEVAAGSSLAD